MLTLVFLMTMTACTQETKLPNEQMDTAIETAVSAPTTIVPTSTSEPIPETATAPATLAVPTSSVAVQADVPLLFIRDNDLWRADLD